MKSNMENRTHIEGYLYEHTLEKKESGPNSKNPGTVYITGTVSIATDNECLNVIPVHYTYVTAVTSGGKANATYLALENILNGTYKSCMKDGKENAAMVRADSAIALNEFYTERNGTEDFVSTRRNEGGFIHLVTDGLAEKESARNTFSCDMLITNVRHIDANEEKGTPEKAIVRGAIFNFRKDLLPVEFSAVHAGAINYFESLEATNKNPVFTKLWGNQISETVTKTITQESAFGEALVRDVKTSRKDWVITGANPEPYIWDDPTTLTAADVNEMMKARELALANLKARSDEYKASKTNGTTNNAKPMANITNDKFNF